MKTIAIIPARGNSKRLPNKNIKLLGGIPLLVHSINYAKQFDCIDAIYVSTDNNDIKQIALKYGALVIDRPNDLSGDLEPTVTALKHVLETINDNAIENVVLLQPTNPLRPKALLNDVFTKFISGDYDSIMTVTRNHHKLGKISENTFIPFNYTMGQRSQDLEPLYYENGLLYITKAKLIFEDKILGNNNFPFVVEHPFENVDIDTEDDFVYAQFILKEFINE
ncbi:acylneuraminate cytidylyltransferase family protein [Thalassobellus sediminis]|uniref:acylneuraminate cytidylyltransferase family protein n=1 Tax=Thalassobellus sediminis TaxID=3367753 RepID=UPI003787849A